MSKGKEFPPRVSLYRQTYEGEPAGMYFADPETPFEIIHEYLSSAEHSHLLAEARRETFNYVALQFERAANLAEDARDARTNRLHAEWLRGKASEGAIE